jgi:hypothetical protein
MSEPPKSKTDAKMLEGREVALATDCERREAIEMAFDYRGDVTIETADGRRLEGYIFDRRADVAEPYIRVMLSGGGGATVPYAQITRLVFSGRDTAAGKSWETWVKRYIEAKTKGERATDEESA